MLTLGMKVVFFYLFRMNSFEFEIGLNQLGVFLEEVKNAGRK